MDKFTLIKYIFTGLFSASAIVTFLLAKLHFKKKLGLDKKCTTRINGQVVGYATVSVAEGIHLPIVAYWVEGREYKVKGPEYSWYSTMSVKTPFSDNQYEVREGEDLSLHVKYSTNSLGGVRHNPMQQLYPLGMALDVYYDPSVPKVAYVKRFAKKGKYLAYWLLMGTAIFSILGIILLWIFL